MEGRFLGLPSIAVSLASNNPRYYDTAAKVALDLVNRLSMKPFDSMVIFNVNVPDIPYEDVQGFEVTRLGTRHSAEPTIRSKDPRGRDIFWIGPAGKAADAGVGTDFHAIDKNKVSITPLRVDITDNAMLPYLQQWLSDSEKEKK